MKKETGILPREIFELKERILQKLGSRFSSLVLFGSYARGDSRQDSDVDLLLIVKEREKGNDEYAELVPVLSQFLLEHGLLVSLMVKSDMEWKTQKNGFLKNVSEEGILV
jgi:predicted nucleotidyltransferase